MDETKKFKFDFAEVNGKIEMIEFLESLDKNDRAKIIANMEKLVQLLNVNIFPNQKISKFLRNGIFELRVNIKNQRQDRYIFLCPKILLFLRMDLLKRPKKLQTKKLTRLYQ